MMPSSLPLLLLALSSVLSAPAAPDDGYTNVVVTQKRAALVLDRLLIALQKALQEDRGPGAPRLPDDSPRAAPVRLGRLDDVDRQLIEHKMALGGEAAPELFLRADEEPRAAPLRIAPVLDDTSALQRRGQGGVRRGTVLRCYFNAITCF